MLRRVIVRYTEPGTILGGTVVECSLHARGVTGSILQEQSS